MANEDVDMREAGIIIGKALGVLRARLDAIEAEKPTFVVPVPKSEIKLPPMAVTIQPAKLEQKIEINPTPVEVLVPKQDPISIDLDGIIKAISSAGVAESIREIGKAQELAAAAAVEAQAATQAILIEMMGAISEQQAQIAAMGDLMNSLGAQVIKALNSPKELTFDANGEPIGVKVSSQKLN